MIKKNHVCKNQEWEPIHQKCKAKESMHDTTQRKNENKQSMKNKEKKTLCK
jgi:hypothetical protein